MGDVVQWVLCGQRLMDVLWYVPGSLCDVVVIVREFVGRSKMVTVSGTVFEVSGCMLFAVGSSLFVSSLSVFID